MAQLNGAGGATVDEVDGGATVDEVDGANVDAGGATVDEVDGTAIDGAHSLSMSLLRLHGRDSAIAINCCDDGTPLSHTLDSSRCSPET